MRDFIYIRVIQISCHCLKNVVIILIYGGKEKIMAGRNYTTYGKPTGRIALLVTRLSQQLVFVERYHHREN
jgi:hypothetical protein